MHLVISNYDLARLLSDLQEDIIGLPGENLNIRWHERKGGNDYFRLKLTRGQIRRLNKNIPPLEIRERYHSQ